MMSGSQHHLSPFDLSGLGAGFGLYRPRRPSYTYATQVGRQRTESYRYAVRKSGPETEENTDFIEGCITKRGRKESYVRATRRGEDSIELKYVLDQCPGNSLSLASTPVKHKEDDITTGVISPTKENETVRLNHISCNDKDAETPGPDDHIEELKAAIAGRSRSPKPKAVNRLNDDLNGRGNAISPNHIVKSKKLPIAGENHVCMADKETIGTPCSELSSTVPSIIVFTFKKNLVFLCISFITLFSSFRAIQNLQSTINEKDNLGIISMSVLHGTMFMTCLWAPSLINMCSAKWSLVFGMFSFLIWTGANFYPTFYTLVPTGILSGFGQGILWTAEISYILKLAFDSSRVTKGSVDKEVMRFHGIFLACFQTTHIWGNLISSLVLGFYIEEIPSYEYISMENISNGMEELVSGKLCGVLYPCGMDEYAKTELFCLLLPWTLSMTSDGCSMNVPLFQRVDMFDSLWKLMCAYLVLGAVGFCLIFFCLDRIGAKVDPDKTSLSIVRQHLKLLVTHKTFRLLIPLLIFSGLQQGFIFSDFTKSFVKCALGKEYIGYSMIVMGVANVTSSFLVAICARLIPREVVFGIGGIIHMAIMIGFLIWIPKDNLVIYFMLAAAWGLCDAVWQTQCNTLICVTCPEDADIAFANYRMLQSFGLAFSFLSGTFMCVSYKLYMLMIMLVVSIMFYVLAEYKVRQVDDVFDEPTT